MVIRWLKAYGRRRVSLSEALKYELSLEHSIMCAEKLVGGKSTIGSKVGLLVKNTAVVRRYKGDVYSSVNHNGRRVRGRRPKNTHTEVWVRPEYIGIVCKRNTKKHHLETVKKAGRKYGLPVFLLTRDGRLVERRCWK